MENKRLIPLMKVGGNLKEYTHEHLVNNEVFSKAVFYETVNGIEEAILNKSKTAILFNVDEKGTSVEIKKNEWNNALSSCIIYYTKLEEYEMCSLIQELQTKI
jgi:hypothetical protein